MDMRPGASMAYVGRGFSRATLAMLFGVAALAALAVMTAVVGRAAPLPPQTKARTLALVGGTLIDGCGGVPIRNSVILVDNERITAVGQVGSLAVPAGAEVISTEG